MPDDTLPSPSPANPPEASWEGRSTALWASIDTLAPADFVARVDALAAELPAGSPAAAFERACAQDSTGHADQAVPLYRHALAGGLTGLRRRRATIQLASSLRLLDQAAQAVDLLSAELAQPDDELSGAVRGFLALALADLGREREALAFSLEALATCLPRYNRSLAHYARALRP